MNSRWSVIFVHRTHFACLLACLSELLDLAGSTRRSALEVSDEEIDGIQFLFHASFAFLPLGATWIHGRKVQGFASAVKTPATRGSASEGSSPPSAELLESSRWRMLVSALLLGFS